MDSGPVKSHCLQLTAGLLGAGAVSVCGVGLTLAVVATLARVLGPETFGVYAYVATLIAILGALAQLGLHPLVVRVTARAEQDREWGVIRGLWRWSVGVTGLMALLIALGVVVGMHLFGLPLPTGHYHTLYWGLLLMPLIAWGNLHAAALTGLRKVVLGQVPENILRPAFLLLLLAAGLLWFPAFPTAADHAMALTVLAGLLSLLVTVALLRWKQPLHVATVRPVHHHGLWLSAAWPLAIVAVMQMINRQTDVLILGLFVPTEKIGVYRVASQGAAVVPFSLQIVNMAVAPHFARLHAAGDTHRLQHLVLRSAQLALFGALPVTAVLALFGDSVLALVFGNAYAKGHTALAILALGQLANVSIGSVGLLLNMAGRHWEAARGLTIGACINVSLNLALVPLWGIKGAALATAVSVLVWNLILWHTARNHLGLNSSAFTILNRTHSA